MQIDSARELKAMCLKQHVKPLTAGLKKGSAQAFGVRGLGLGARAVTQVDPTQRTMAIGISYVKQTYQLAVRLQARALEKSPQVEAIRSQARGEVDVRYIGRVVKRAAPWNQSRQRPLLPGISIGHFRITAGTLGCFVKMRSSGDPRILSNNHVLADENAGKKGDAVIQAGHFDGGRKPKDTVGKLNRFVRLDRTAANLVDCALATIRSGVQFDAATLKGIGKLSGGPGPIPDIGSEVHKVGRTTDVTHGRVTAFELDNVVVAYDIGNLSFDNQIEIEGAGQGPFSEGGDSGSLIVNEDRLAVALLFAGGDQGGTNGQGLTFANPISQVFDDLGVELLF